MRGQRGASPENIRGANSESIRAGFHVIGGQIESSLEAIGRPVSADDILSMFDLSEDMMPLLIRFLTDGPFVKVGRSPLYRWLHIEHVDAFPAELIITDRDGAHKARARFLERVRTAVCHHLECVEHRSATFLDMLGVLPGILCREREETRVALNSALQWLELNGLVEGDGQTGRNKRYVLVQGNRT